jgi:hypothetical protein
MLHGASTLLILTAQAAKVILEGKFPIMSSADRQEVKKAD